MNSLQLILWGLGMLAAAFMLRRSAQLAQRDRDPILPQKESPAVEPPASQIQKLELRLHDYGREVEGRIETNLALLDRLLAEADDEIVRLETLLEAARGMPRPAARRAPDILAFAGTAVDSPERPPRSERPLPPEHRRMIAHLAGAGYRAAETARLLERPLPQIEAVLAQGRRPETDAA